MLKSAAALLLKDQVHSPLIHEGHHGILHGFAGHGAPQGDVDAAHDPEGSHDVDVADGEAGPPGGDAVQLVTLAAGEAAEDARIRPELVDGQLLELGRQRGPHGDVLLPLRVEGSAAVLGERPEVPRQPDGGGG